MSSTLISLFQLKKNHLLCWWSCSEGFAYLYVLQLTESCVLLVSGNIWVPKYRLRILKGDIKDLVESDIRKLCEWKKCEVGELNVQEDHVRLVVSVPPKVSISSLMGVLKGEIAIMLFKSYLDLKKKPYWGNHFWARGYFVSTVGLDVPLLPTPS